MAKKISYLQSKITDHREISPGYFRLSFFAPKIAQIAQPGQFVHIYCGEGTYLRRPFSIAGVKKNQVEIIYKVVGKGTGLLSQKKKGEVVDVIGPLGTGFSYSPVTNHQSPVLIAGGTGVASLLFLAQKLVTRHPGLAPRSGAGSSLVTIFIGAKTKNDLLCVSDFKKLGCQVKVSTEDGSLGFKGLVSDLFRSSLVTRHSSLVPAVFACGPYGMLKKVAEICREYNLPCQISLENIMACGIGACRGCAIKTQITADVVATPHAFLRKQEWGGSNLTGIASLTLAMTKATQISAMPRRQVAEEAADKFKYKTVCKDGPVFDVKKIIWE